MTKSQHEALIKFSQLSHQRELCDVKERKLKRFRNTAFLIFSTSILLTVAHELATHQILFESINVRMAPGKEFTFLVLGIISFVFLLFAIFKLLGAQLNAEQARRQEGLMAQKAFAMMLIKTK